MNILEQIVQTKRKEIRAARQLVPLRRLQAAAAAASPVRNLFAACTAAPKGLVNVIAEVKKASPSAGVIRNDFDPAAIARQYAAAGAVAISVLTDQQYFRGSLHHLREVREAVDLPVLRKDFVVDPYQVFEARAAGADGILLIAECLTPSEMSDLMILAASLKLTCLIEVHNREQFDRVRPMIRFPHASYNLLGVNNRDLTTFNVDIATTIHLADKFDDRRRLVSESGIKTRYHVEQLSLVGINTVLIGETLMRARDIGAKFAELFGR